MKKNWTVNEISRQVHRVTFTNIRAGWEQYVLIKADDHYDSAHCDRDLLSRHHREAVARGAPVFCFGDLFDAMQGKWDKRADQNQLRPEHRGNNYLDKLVNTATDYYGKFADSLALITPGNHEQSILDRHQTNITERLVTNLRHKSDTVHMGGYWGFVLFTFGCGKPITKQLHYHHGYGGGGEVTRGFIDNNRTRGQYNADIFVSGHVHRRNMDENIITECTGNGAIALRKQLFLRASTYKNETDGWHATKGRAARPIGGWWLRFSYRTTKAAHHIDMQAIAAN